MPMHQLLANLNPQARDRFVWRCGGTAVIRDDLLNVLNPPPVCTNICSCIWTKFARMAFRTLVIEFAIFETASIETKMRSAQFFMSGQHFFLNEEPVS